MKLLSSLINESQGLSLNDLTLLQRLMLKKVYTGRIDAFDPDLSDSQVEVLDSLVDLGLLDSAYEVTSHGAKAADMLDSYAKQEKEDIGVAKEIAAAEIKGKNFEDGEDFADEFDDFPFTEGEQIIMKAAGLNSREIAKLFLREDTIPKDAILVIDGHHGVYVPQIFAQQFNASNLAGVKRDDLEIVKSGPDHEHYWDAWTYILDNATFEENGVEYYLMQDQDLWAVPVGSVHDSDDDYPEEGGVDDYSDDGDALASAGWGTDEDYGYFGDEY